MRRAQLAIAHPRVHETGQDRNCQGRCRMHSPAYYREMAEKYAADALRATDPEARAALLDMADNALKLAEQAAAAAPGGASGRKGG